MSLVSRLILVALLWMCFASRVVASPAEVIIYAGYSLGFSTNKPNVEFDLPKEYAGLKAVADREPLANRGSVVRCETTALGEGMHKAYFVRLVLRLAVVEKFSSTFFEWHKKNESVTRAIIFVLNGKVLHAHPGTEVTISDNDLLMFVGPEQEAIEIRRAICG